MLVRKTAGRDATFDPQDLTPDAAQASAPRGVDAAGARIDEERLQLTALNCTAVSEVRNAGTAAILRHR